MTDSNDVRPEKKKKFSLFKKKEQLDEFGNPLVLPKKRKFSYHRLNRSLGGDLALTIVLFVGGVFMLFPLIYSISNSLKPLSEQWIFPPNLIVKNPTFEWYISLFNYMGNSMVPMSRYLCNIKASLQRAGDRVQNGRTFDDVHGARNRHSQLRYSGKHEPR